jgi:hypothetical protein
MLSTVSWPLMGAADPTTLTDTRLQVHQAAQLVAGLGFPSCRPSRTLAIPLSNGCRAGPWPVAPSPVISPFAGRFGSIQ